MITKALEFAKRKHEGQKDDGGFWNSNLAGYPSLLSQEHNIRLAVRLLADAHPNPTSSDFAKLNIKLNGGKRWRLKIYSKRKRKRKFQRKSQKKKKLYLKEL